MSNTSSAALLTAGTRPAVRFELSPASDGTELVLIDEVEPSAAARNAVGWEGCLDLLEGRPSAPDQ
ncbi:MAG: hypothetical protein EPN48_08350 [Microbacteriaceae bacterium]|nr:MAG: hypothetical protein EPN48_08350 [Microbacteriaceae bacterium]